MGKTSTPPLLDKTVRSCYITAIWSEHPAMATQTILYLNLHHSFQTQRWRVSKTEREREVTLHRSLEKVWANPNPGADTLVFTKYLRAAHARPSQGQQSSNLLYHFTVVKKVQIR